MTTPSTVDISRGQQRSGRSVDRTQALARVYQDALASGLGEEGARAAVAIAQTEGGFNGDVGDVSGGGSYGTFQFYAQGQLPNFAAANKMTVAQAKDLLRRDPMAGNRWALSSSGYLGRAIRTGIGKGLKGPALATHAQRTGQVSVSPERAGQNYQALWSTNQPAITGGGKAVTTTTTTTTTAGGARASLEGRTKLRDKYQADLTAVETALKEAEAALDAPDAKDDYGRVKPALTSRVNGLRSKVKAAQTQLNRAENDLAKAQDAGGGGTGAKTTVKESDAEPNLSIARGADGTVWGINPRTGEKVNLGLGSNADQTMTPNEVDDNARGWASLEVQKQNSAIALMREQISAGRLDFDQAKDFLDRVDAMPPAVSVGGKWYVAGMEPGGIAATLSKKYGFGFSPQEANTIDVAGALGRPDLNRHVLAGPYHDRLNQYGVKTGAEAPDKAAGPGADTATDADSPAGPESAPAPSQDAEVSALQWSSAAAPPVVPPAGEPGGATLPQVQANEQPPRRTAAALAPPGGQNALTPQQAQQSPLAADYRGPDQNATARAPVMPSGIPGKPVQETEAMRVYTPAGAPPTAADYPTATPTPQQASLVGAAAPIGGPAFGDQRLTQAVARIKQMAAQQGDQIDDETALAEARRYLTLQGG